MEMLPVKPVVSDYLHRKATALGIPISGNFELTPRCNMHCRMCYVQNQIDPDLLYSADEWLDLAEQAKEHGMLYLLLTGGEVFTRQDFRYILQNLHRMGFLISINTNGTLINEETISWLKETPPIRLNVTLYGASEETYSSLCGNEKAFQMAFNAVKLLKKNGFSLKVNYSVTPENAGDVPKVNDFCRKIGVPLDPTCYMYPQSRKMSYEPGQNECRFSPEDAGRAALDVARIIGGEEWLFRKIQKDGLPELVQDCDISKSEKEEGSPVWCRAGRSSFWITWHGEMQACAMFSEGTSGGNVFQRGFLPAWNDVHEKTKKIRLPARCVDCELKHQCMACAAIVYTETGTFHEVPEYRCQMMHHYVRESHAFVKEFMEKNQ